ncbi:MAG: hypothetical protein A4E57_00359 [Syntrophorhabdaceae bacterium PtaU1.Bin034]|nr:MAG: hypothetical protein A4E57_00359 [Syntrophorhabdaceae bacterium PtaU1.Bin034]
MEFLTSIIRRGRAVLTPARGRGRTASCSSVLSHSGVAGRSLAIIMIAVTVLLLGSALPSFAITAPTSGSLFFDVYDIVVNSMLKGAVGFVAAILVFMMGIGLFFVQKIIPGIIGVVCAALIIKADSIVTTLGVIF